MTMTTEMVSDIAATLPGATRVFRQYGIDFCCGGRRTLAEAAEATGTDLEELKTALTAGTGLQAVAPARMPTAGLIELIVERYHAGHRADLAELQRLAERVETAHARHPACPTGLLHELVETAQEMEPHMQKEEQILFPMMLEGGSPFIVGPIARMVEEHHEVAHHLRRLRALTSGFTVPEGASAGRVTGTGSVTSSA